VCERLAERERESIYIYIYMYMHMHPFFSAKLKFWINTYVYMQSEDEKLGFLALPPFRPISCGGV
jgi:hypothetical protein